MLHKFNNWTMIVIKSLKFKNCCRETFPKFKIVLLFKCKCSWFLAILLLSKKLKEFLSSSKLCKKLRSDNFHHIYDFNQVHYLRTPELLKRCILLSGTIWSKNIWNWKKSSPHLLTKSPTQQRYANLNYLLNNHEQIR